MQVTEQQIRQAIDMHGDTAFLHHGQRFTLTIKPVGKSRKLWILTNRHDCGAGFHHTFRRASDVAAHLDCYGIVHPKWTPAMLGNPQAYALALAEPAAPDTQTESGNEIAEFLKAAANAILTMEPEPVMPELSPRGWLSRSREALKAPLLRASFAVGFFGMAAVRVMGY